VQFLRVKNWDTFQQYKDRDPKWIKVHRDLLYDYEFDRLEEVAQIHLVKIWLLAAKLGNRIPNDPVWVARQIGAKSKVNINQLCTNGFLIPYESVQNGTETYLEEEVYKEEEEREEKPRIKRAPAKTRLAETELPDTWRAYCITKRPDLDPDAAFENFRDYWTGHGKAMANWLATWQRWVRNEQSGISGRKGAVRETNDERRAREADEHRRRILAG